MKKIALIGLGRWGKNLVREFSNVSLITKCHTKGNQTNIRWLKKHYPEIKWVKDRIDIFSDPTIDAVIISTPIATHFKLAKECLDNGKHVFIEKPMAETTAQSRKLISIAKTNKVQLFVGHVFLYSQNFKKILEVTKNRKIKCVQFDWKKLGTFDEDIFKNLLTHDLSLSIELLGMPKKINLLQNLGIITSSDIISIKLYYNDNKICNIKIDRTSNFKKKTITVITEKNLYQWEDDILLRLQNKSKTYKQIFQQTETPLAVECKEFIKSISKPNISYHSATLALNVNVLIDRIIRQRK